MLSLDRAVGDFEQADVLIEGTKISAVRPNITVPNAEIIDAANTIVMPGFVDTHRHMWQGTLRNVLPDGSLEDYIRVVQRTFGAKLTPDDVYVADLLSALGAIDSGVTCVLDWSHIHITPEHTDAVHQGAAPNPACARCSPTAARKRASGRWSDAPGHKYPEDIARLRKQYFSSEDQLMTLYLAAPSGAPDVILPAVQGRPRCGRPHQHPCQHQRVCWSSSMRPAR